MPLITVPEMAVDEPLPLPEPDVPPEPLLPPLPDPLPEPEDDPAPEVPPEFDELPGVTEPLAGPLPPEPVWEGDMAEGDGLFAAVGEEPPLPQPINSTAELRMVALTKDNKVLR